VSLPLPHDTVAVAAVGFTLQLLPWTDAALKKFYTDAIFHVTITSPETLPTVDHIAVVVSPTTRPDPTDAALKKISADAILHVTITSPETLPAVNVIAVVVAPRTRPDPTRLPTPTADDHDPTETSRPNTNKNKATLLAARV
jgi:hypothetical protein